MPRRPPAGRTWTHDNLKGWVEAKRRLLTESDPMTQCGLSFVLRRHPFAWEPGDSLSAREDRSERDPPFLVSPVIRRAGRRRRVGEPPQDADPDGHRPVRRALG